MFDYGFAPGDGRGGDLYDDDLREMFRRRKRTKLIFDRRTTTLQDFIKYLETQRFI